MVDRCVNDQRSFKKQQSVSSRCNSLQSDAGSGSVYSHAVVSPPAAPALSVNARKAPFQPAAAFRPTVLDFRRGRVAIIQRSAPPTAPGTGSCVRETKAL